MVLHIKIPKFHSFIQTLERTDRTSSNQSNHRESSKQMGIILQNHVTLKCKVHCKKSTFAHNNLNFNFLVFRILDGQCFFFIIISTTV